MEKPRMLFIPYAADEDVRFVTTFAAFNAIPNENTQCFSIGSNLTLLCRGHPDSESNPHLAKYNVKYPGYCLIYSEDNSGKVDNLPDNFVSKLPEIFAADKKKQEEFAAMLSSSSGFDVIN